MLLLDLRNIFVQEKELSSRLRIGVLMGGRSIEREVSLNSGRTICDHLDTQCYDIIPLFQNAQGHLYILPWHFLHRGKINDFLHRLDEEAESLSWDALKKRVDFIFPAVHGRYAEDGILQGTLEVLGIPYLGSKLFGSALSMNKMIQKKVLKAAGIDVARDLIIHPSDLETLSTENLITKLTDADLSFPLIVKPNHEGSSLGISIVFKPEELITAIEKAATTDTRHLQPVLVEEKLEGMEFVCVSLEKNKSWFSLPITEVRTEESSHFFDYDQKYMPGRARKITPARCTQGDHDRIIDVCHNVTKLLHMSTISRIDGFLTHDGRIVIIDPNSLTGMAPATFIFHQAAESGMNHTDLINFLIEQELKSYGLLQDPPTSKGSDMNQKTNKKIRVAVLLGGDSNEREISLESGRNVCYKLSPHKYEVLPIFVNDKMELYKLSQKLLIKNSTQDITELVTPEIQIEWSSLPDLCDFVFIGLHGGKGENGGVQAICEMLDLPYNGSGVLASSMCMNKKETNEFLYGQGFNVPQSKLLTKDTWIIQEPSSHEAFLIQQLDTINFPVIIKPHDDGCSMMVQKAKGYAELINHLNKYFSFNKNTVMIEEFINGTEITCGVLGNDKPDALPPSMTISQKDILSMEEKFLPGAGENQTPAPLPDNIITMVQETVAKAYKAIECTGYSRIDCFYQDKTQSPTGKDRVVILEVNTLPALTPATCLFHQAAEVGIQAMQLIDTIVQLGFAKHKKPVAQQLVGTARISNDIKEKQNPTNHTMKLF